jgi:telomerase reverse transcriptase
MAGKRKRKRPDTKFKGLEKRQRISNSAKAGAAPNNLVVKQALLSQFYPEVFTLREYLLSRLPTASKIRRKKILSVGSSQDAEVRAGHGLSSFLDRTLVGVLKGENGRREDRWRHWGAFSQKADGSLSTLINLNSVGRYSQSEVGFNHVEVL